MRGKKNMIDMVLVGGPAPIEDATQAMTSDWRDLLDQHLNQALRPTWPVVHSFPPFIDNSDRMPRELLDEMMREVKGIMNDPNVQWMHFDEDGNLVASN